jgi:hypothetical protein
MTVPKPIRAAAAGIVFFAATLVTPSAVSAKNIVLAFSPGKNPAQVPTSDMPGWPGHAVKVLDVVDDREHVSAPGNGTHGNNDVLGISLERDREPYITGENVPFWLGRSIMVILQANRISVVRDNPSIIIEPRLKKLFVTEESTYHGKACIEFTVSSAQGSRLWSDTVCDSSNYWGSTLSEEDFLHALGNAVVNTVGKLLQDPQLNEILSKEQQPATKVRPVAIKRPEDLGIRGTYRSAPRGMTVASGVLLVAGTAVLVAMQSSADPGTRSASVLCIPLYVAGGVIGIIAGVKWSLWYNWYYIKPPFASSSVRPQLIVACDLP